MSGVMYAQTLKGKVSDSGNTPLTGVSVIVAGTTTGVSTDNNGEYSLKLSNGTYQVRFSFVGFTTVTETITINGTDATLNVVLSPTSESLNEVVVVGGRATQRTVTDSPLPVDILSANDLKTTGQTTFDKTLQYRVPSFNTVNTPVNDATTLLDPYEIRNLGPSRTLILVNGKRKNLSSLLYVQFSPGRGETGVDLSAIPTDAIKRVEILRDGASAQYGSDAIAGVMNVILKDKYEYSSLNVTSGITGKGDGGNYGLSFNSGANFAEKGYINYTAAFNQQNSAVRSGIVDVPTEIATFGVDDSGKEIPAQAALIRTYLKDYPTANNINGTGATTAAKFLVNGGIPVGGYELYGNAALVVKKVTSFANFRTPYWRQDRGLLHSITDNGGKNYITKATLMYPGQDSVDLYRGYTGYVPTFEGDLIDHNATVGIKGITNGWKHDVSITTGFNQQTYTVDNTVNRSLGKSSPTRFKPGGYSFSHIVGNIDFSKLITPELSIAFGSEIRSETFRIIAGDSSSYYKEGSNSFPGIRTENATTNNRFNFGGYFDVSYDIMDSWVVNGTVRAENYSDFGSAFVWKGSTRYKILDDKIILRGSASSGFRAPTLHQIYAQSTQAAFVGGTIQLSGLFNNRSSQARQLGIPALKPERSTNYTVGLALNPAQNFSITLDYYNITIKDRVVYSSSISSSNSGSILGQILTAANVKTIQFFINGIKTQTQGLDYVLNYRNIPVGTGKLAASLAGNFTLKNEIVGTPNDPESIKADGASILSTQIKSLLTESRPRYKSILALDYTWEKLHIGLYNTLFGPTKFQDLDNGGSDMQNIKQVFSPAVVTDLTVGYDFSKNITASATINNLLNILPKWKLEAINSNGQAVLNDPDAKNLLEGFLTFSGRYRILGYNGSQFSQLGTTFQGNLTFKF
jgi:iron complex outermembrane receptor protein